MDALPWIIMCSLYILDITLLQKDIILTEKITDYEMLDRKQPMNCICSNL